jgi:hypothetical protein
LEIDEDLYPLKFKCISANRENWQNWLGLEEKAMHV